MLIALTAYIPEYKRELANSIAPVCFRESTQDAQEKGLLNKTRFIQVNFDLSHDRNIKVKKKDGNFFYQAENAYYLYYEEAIQKAIIAKSILEGKSNSNSLMNIDNSEVAKKLAKSKYQMEYLIRKRRELLHTLISSQKVSQNLIKAILEQNRTNKILVMSKLTEQIDKITANTFHTKNKGDAINLFEKDVSRVLGVCEILNRGANLSGVSHIIKESYVGSDTDFQQQHGRGMRLSVDDTMTFIILLPHFWIRVAVVDDKKNLIKYEWVRRPTQAKRWLEDMIAEFSYEPTIIEVAKDYSVVLI